MPRTIIGSHQHRAALDDADVSHTLGTDRDGLPAAGPLPAIRRRRLLNEAPGEDQSQVIRAQRQAGEAFEHRGHGRVCQHAPLTRQNQGGHFASAREDEKRRAERRGRLEPHGAAGFKAGEHASAHALLARASG